MEQHFCSRVKHIFKAHVKLHNALIIIGMIDISLMLLYIILICNFAKQKPVKHCEFYFINAIFSSLLSPHSTITFFIFVTAPAEQNLKTLHFNN